MPEGLQGMTKDDMVKYVQYVTDIVLTDFGCKAEFNVGNPLEFMARIGLSAKNNFFEQRVGEYSRVEIPSTMEGVFDDEF
jgi:ribonucleotide reductase beta subunit family protein with ferritin-like domain